jgi:hypothetical protein
MHWWEENMRYLKITFAGAMLWFAAETPAYCAGPGTVESGSALCGEEVLHVFNKVGKDYVVPREQDAYVAPTDYVINWKCGNEQNALSITCPVQTNQMHVHRQKADNAQWLYDCQVN